MARVLAEGSIEELDNAAIVRISLTRGALPDVLAQLSCLRFAVTEQLRVKVANQILELRFGEGLASKDRARIGVRDSGYVLELSLTELDAWLKFLTSCYWRERPSVDHVDLLVFDDKGKEYNIVLAVETAVDLRSPDEARQALNLDSP